VVPASTSMFPRCSIAVSVSRLLSPRLLAVCLMLAFASSCGEGTNPKVVDASVLPVCKMNGKHYSSDQLIKILVERFVSGEIGSDCLRYRSTAEFLERNPDCCGVRFNIDRFGWATAEQPPRRGRGYVIGTFDAVYYCGSPASGKRVYRDTQTTVSACGDLLDRGSLDTAFRRRVSKVLVSK
jgi:hypothetical protein